jgi:hypothetical protein
MAGVRAATPRRWTVVASGGVQSIVRWTALGGGPAIGAPKPGRRPGIGGAVVFALALVGARVGTLVDAAGEADGAAALGPPLTAETGELADVVAATGRGGGDAAGEPLLDALAVWMFVR